MTLLVKRLKPSPDPAIRSALTRQFWMTSEQVATRAKLPTPVVARRMRRMWNDGELDRQPGDGGTFVYRLTNRRAR